MKFAAAILIAIFLVLSLAGCHTALTGDFSDAPTEMNAGSILTACSKDSVAEFMAAVGDIHSESLLSGADFSEETCFNVTPESVAAQTDVKIFKFSQTGASFVLIDGKAFVLCTFFGGHGFVNAVPCDFNNDGNWELLVASSWGSGLHRSQITVFDLQTKTSTLLFDTTETDEPRTDLIVGRDASGGFVVYSVEIQYVGKDLAALSYTVTGVMGSIQEDNGEPVFVPSYQGYQ